MKDLNSNLEISLKDAEKSIWAEHLKEIAGYEWKQIKLESDIKDLEKEK